MLSDNDFRLLLNTLDRPWSGYRKVRKGVKKRVRRHMTAIGCTTIEDYLSAINRSSAARIECESRLTVTISRFYRDRHLWRQMGERFLPVLAKRFPAGLRAWSAGCANGEEPYTLSMVWEELASKGHPLPVLEILATDAKAACLQRGRHGEYPASSLKEVPEHMKRRWFQKVPGTKLWRIDKQLQKRICWQSHQLLDAPPMGKVHLILLRNNVLTYYRGWRLETAFKRISAVLTDGGILVVGSHERPPSASWQERQDPVCPWVYSTMVVP